MLPVRSGRSAAGRLCPGPRPRGLRAVVLLAASLLPLQLGIGLGGAAQAIPRLDLRPYPAPAAGERRWVIQLPGVLPPTTDSRISPSPSDWRVELIFGRELEVDCNSQRFGGKVRSETLPGLGYPIYRVRDVGPVVSTRMACPPGSARRKAFVPMGSKPFVVPYNASLPIVIYAPQDLDVRWRLWKAERQQRPANVL
ncbi:MAG: ecotin family protein [Cyanobium sp.]